MHQSISTPAAPAAVGPYSQAVVFEKMVFASGQIPLDPATGALENGDIRTQTHRCMKNLGAVLKAAGAGFDTIVKTTIFVSDMNEFAAVNEIYASYFSQSMPARSCVAARTLPKNVDVEIEAIAYVK